MFKKFANKLFQKPPVETEEEDIKQESLFAITFRYEKDEGIYVDVNTLEDEGEVDVKKLAELITFIGSISGQMELLDIIRQGLDDETDRYDRFIGHFLTFKTQEITDSNETTGTDEPCISPLEML